MSKTIIGALLQFSVAVGLLSASEMETASQGVMAVIALASLVYTVYGRIVAKGPLFGDD